MMFRHFFLIFLAVFLPHFASAEDNSPRVSPTATYTDAEGELQEVTKIDDGEAPLEVTFKANPQNMEELSPSFVWRFRKQGEETDMLVRYEEETVYRFVDSGTFDVSVTAYNGEELIDSAAVTVTISESRLEFPNAFSPNDDKINDIYGAKGVNDEKSTAHYKSIVEFHAYIFNRWGQKLFEWTDVSKGWDGTYKGRPVKEGVYYVLVKAKGADGKVYNIRKDVNLLRGYTEESSTTNQE